MKLGEIVKARDEGVIDFLSDLVLGDGKVRYKLRKAIAAIEHELKIADEERMKLVHEIAPELEGKQRAGPQDSPNFGKLIDAIDSFYSADSSIEIVPPFTESDLEKITMSVAQENAIRALGMVAEEKEQPK
jgi:hypothetical protein